MNCEWISIKESGLPNDENYYWVTIDGANNWFRTVVRAYYLKQDNNNSYEFWFYDEDCENAIDNNVVAYMHEIIPEPYQGE